jgi:hypothetical protein
MKIQNKWQAEEKAGGELAQFLAEFGLDVFGELIPFWAAAVVVAVVALCAVAIKLFED